MSDQPPSPDIKAIVDGLSRPAFAKDIDLRFVALNGAFERAFEVSSDALIGRTTEEVFALAALPEERQVLAFGADQSAEFSHDGRDYFFTLRREGSLYTVPFLVGTLDSTREQLDFSSSFATFTSPCAPPPPAPSPAPSRVRHPDGAMDDLARISEHMKTGVVLLDRTLTILAVNDMLYIAWGVDPSTVGIGDSFGDFLDAGRANRSDPRDDDAAWRAHTGTVLDAIASGTVPKRDIPLKDGRTLYASGVLLSGSRSMLTFDDVSLRDHSVDTVAALKETAETSERLMHSVLDKVPAAVVVYDRNNDFVLDNRGRHAMFPEHDHVMKPGATLADFVDLLHDRRVMVTSEVPELDAIHDTDPVAWKARRIAEYDAPFRSVERRTKDGRWLQVVVRRLEDGMLIMTWIDVSEIKEREVALDKVNTVAQTSLKTLYAAIEAMPDGMAISDREERIVVWNEQFMQQFPGVDVYSGMRIRDILRDFAHTGVVPGIEGREDAWAQEKFTEWREGANGEHVFETHDGRWIKRVDRRAAEGLRVSLRLDVTELKRREIELEKAKVLAESAERSKSEFLANMSHEIRTPMNGILGMAEILSNTELNDRQRNFAGIIVSSGNALLTIINDILDFSKIDAGQLKLYAEPFSLSRAIDDVATLLSTRAVEKGIETIVRVAPDMPDRLLGDAGRLRQIVTNLMGNAVKFTDEGHVLVDIEGVPGADGGATVAMRCRVVDTGIGIPDDRLEDIFDSFSQVDGSSTRQYEGTGLGLAIATRLVWLMGGEIGCESEVGKGSVFWFEVPFSVDGTAEKAPVPPTDLMGCRVLVIDDNEVNRAILLEQLGGWQFDGETAESGEEALSLMRDARAAGRPFDAVILDYHMPRMNGLQVARAIRSDDAIAHTPIVMLTSIDLDANASEFRTLEIEGYLVKPARSSTLMETLIEAMRAPSIDPVPVEPMPAAMTGCAVSEAPSDEARPDVLVADDNAVNQMVMSEMLAVLGFSSITAEDGIVAVETWRARRPRIVLMDVTMPRMDGHDATRAIRMIEADEAGGDAGEEDAHVPIIGATAHAADSDRLACLDAGMDDYISKPIRHGDLRTIILRWLDKEEGADATLSA